MEKDTTNAEALPTPEGEDVAAISDASAQLEALAAQRDQLEKERAELNARLLRMAAEFDNFRKRTDREKSEAVEYGSYDALKALLPILDDFERAQKMEVADSEYARGMALIYQRMSDAMRKLGLEPIEAEGKPFDPNIHFAIDRCESPDVEVDTVVAEYQRGYIFKSRLLRAAMVKVAVKG